MAVQKKALRITDREAAFKIYGSEGSATISLDNDLLTANQILDPAGTRKATITELQWSGDVDVVIEVVRNSVVIATMQANNPGMLLFGVNYVENLELESDIVVNIVRGSNSKNGQLWITITKNSGFKAKYEPAQFGSYDNPNVSGA